MTRRNVMRKASTLFATTGILVVVTLLHPTPATLRRNLSDGTKLPAIKYKLTEQAQAWCHTSNHPPLNYRQCDQHRGALDQIEFASGLTNSLKRILLTAITSFEKNRCFFVTEDTNPLIQRQGKSQQQQQQLLTSFIDRYFEPIGLSPNDPIVARAIAEGRVQKVEWSNQWSPIRKKMIHGKLHNITNLGYQDIESTELKKIMLRRMWRFLPSVRNESCATLESHGLEDEYLAFSVRRGDKNMEGFEFTKSNEYVDAAEEAFQAHFNGSIPKIFVATDDCAVMSEFRDLRPQWNFTSECDHTDTHSGGFVLQDMKQWSLEETDEHFRKFFVELIGLAGAKFYIGVSYTNVAWWTAHMRPHRWSHQYLDIHDKTTLQFMDRW